MLAALAIPSWGTPIPVPTGIDFGRVYADGASMSQTGDGIGWYPYLMQTGWNLDTGGSVNQYYGAYPILSKDGQFVAYDPSTNRVLAAWSGSEPNASAWETIAPFALAIAPVVANVVAAGATQAAATAADAGAGWVSAEGGAGYAGGLAADASELTVASGGVAADGIDQFQSEMQKFLQQQSAADAGTDLLPTAGGGLPTSWGGWTPSLTDLRTVAGAATALQQIAGGKRSGSGTIISSGMLPSTLQPPGQAGDSPAMARAAAFALPLVLGVAAGLLLLGRKHT